MNSKNAGAIRGLSITVIVFSAIAAFGFLVALVVVGITGAVWNEAAPDLIQYSYNAHDHSLAGQMDANGLSESDLMGIGALGIAIGVGIVIWELATAVVALIAGIVGTANAKKKNKLGGVFLWGIIGAVAALLGMRLITMVLLIVIAVLAKQAQKAPEVETAGYATVSGYAAVGYAGRPAAASSAGYAQTYGAGQVPTAQPYAPQQQPAQPPSQPVYEPQPASSASENVTQASVVSVETVPATGASDETAGINTAEASPTNPGGPQ